MRSGRGSVPFKTVLDRGPWVRRDDKDDLGHPDPVLTIPEFNTADVAFEIDGGGFDEDGLAGIKDSAVGGSGDSKAGFSKRIINDENRGAGARGIDRVRRAGDRRANHGTIKNPGDDSLDAFR